MPVPVTTPVPVPVPVGIIVLVHRHYTACQRFFSRDIFFRARDNFRKNARDIEKTAMTIFDQKKWPWHFFECPWQKSKVMPVTRFLRPWHFSKSARDTKNHARGNFRHFFSLQLEIWFLSKYFKCKWIFGMNVVSEPAMRLKFRSGFDSWTEHYFC